MFQKFIIWLGKWLTGVKSIYNAVYALNICDKSTVTQIDRTDLVSMGEGEGGMI